MELLFIHVLEHKVLRDVSIPLSSRYLFNFQENCIKITENPDYLGNYYDNVNVSAIIGRNGAGKTSALEFIESFFSYTTSSGFFIWFEESRQEFFIQKINYHNKIKFDLFGKSTGIRNSKGIDFEHFKILKINNVSNHNFSRKRNKKVVNLSAESQSNTKNNKRKSIEKTLNFISSDFWQERHERVTYKFKFRGWNSTIKNWIKHSFEHIEGQDRMNLELFSDLLEKERNYSRRKSRDILEKIEGAWSVDEYPEDYQDYLSAFSDVKIHDLEGLISGSYHLLDESITVGKLRINTEFLPAIYKNVLAIFKRQLEVEAIEGNLMCAICVELVSSFDNDNSLSIIDNVETIFIRALSRVEELQTPYSKRIDYDISKEKFDFIYSEISSSIQNTLEFFNDLSNESYLTPVSGINDLAISDDWDHYNESERAIRLFKMKKEQRKRFLRDYSLYSGFEEFESRSAEGIFFVLELLDNAQDILKTNFDYGWDGLSSGEFAKINIFSTIYHELNFIGDPCVKLESKRLILLDEVDLYLHPEWQRTFIHELIELIKSQNSTTTVQIILSSHSPLIIGDLLPEDIVTLKVDNGRTQVKPSLGFGTKLSDFYLEGMHLDSTYGEHSKRKLEKLLYAKMNNKTLNSSDRRLADKVCNKALREALLGD